MSTSKPTKGCGCDSVKSSSSKKGFIWEDERVTICSPMKIGQPIIPQSCLTKSALLRIVDSWNHSNSDPNKYISLAQTMSANDLYRKVESTMKQEFGCKSEDCWVESLEHPEGAREQLLSLFQPKYPDSFKKNSNSWWSSSQIDAVIRPYTYSHPFYWCGVVPLDFKEQRSIKICLSREICSVNLLELIERGCCLVAAIFNLDYSWESGSHWVAGLVDLRRGDVCFFDSYGYEPLGLIKEWMDNCSQSLNQLIENDKWINCLNKRLYLTPKDIQWKSYKEFDVKKKVSNRLKINVGMWLWSEVSGRKYQIIAKQSRRTYVLNKSISKTESEGEWTIVGARTYSLSRKVQRSSTECGSFCIHLVLEAMQGKEWYDIINNLPTDNKIKELRIALHRQVKKNN